MSERCPAFWSVAAIAHLPFQGNAGRGFQIEGQPPAAPGQMPGANYTVACPNYFRTMGIPILKGREFTEQDTLSAPNVIVINEKMASDYWPNADPVGRAIRLGGSDGPRLTVVGVVGAVRFQGLDAPPREAVLPAVYAGRMAGDDHCRAVNRHAQRLCHSGETGSRQRAARHPRVQHRHHGEHRPRFYRRAPFPHATTERLLDPGAGARGRRNRRSGCHSVTQRTHEIGIRMALGANAVDVLRLMINSSMLWVLVGLIAGVAGSAALTRWIAGLLYDVQPLDPVVLGGVALLLGAVALLASYLPARRAARIDPLVALRCE